MKLELLSPGGSAAGMRGAINAGADAIYMGGTKFGARAYAQNPEGEDLISCIDECHLHGKKLYLTVNTLLRERELEGELYEYFLPCYEHGVDAVLVQDPGVLHFFKKEFPNLDIHISTQMSVDGVPGAVLAKRMGASRIVPARELSLEEIRSISEQVDIEIECFVHGALCYCYSGQCLMSSIIGGRSGNRGRCAQPCRLPWQRTDDDRYDPYLLSLKDICTLRLLPELIRAGVCSFKIEGRMKRPEYAAGVTAVYRRYLDLAQRFLAGKGSYEVDPQDERDLMDLFNRGGFSKGYYLIESASSLKETMLSSRIPDHMGTEAALLVSSRGHTLSLQAKEDLYRGDICQLMTGSEDGKGRFREALRKSGRDSSGSSGGRGAQDGSSLRFTITADHKKGEIFQERINSAGFAPPDTVSKPVVYRIHNEKLLTGLHESLVKQEKKIGIEGVLRFRKEQPVSLEVRTGSVSHTVSGAVPAPAKSQPMSREDLFSRMTRTGQTIFEFERLDIEIDDGLFLPVRELNELRRSALEGLKEKILRSFERRKGEAVPSGPDRKEPDEDSGSRSVNRGSEAGYKDSRSVTPLLTVNVQTAEQMECALIYDEITSIRLDSLMFLDQAVSSGNQPDVLRSQIRTFAERIHDAGRECLLTLPPIWRRRAEQSFYDLFTPDLLSLFDGFLLRSMGQLGGLERLKQRPDQKILTDHNLYVWNTQGASLIHTLGADICTLPLELNASQMKDLAARCITGGKIGAFELPVYGYTPLMISAQCVTRNTQGCTKNPKCLHLKDRTGACLPVKNHCGICTNLIYNSLPTDLTPMAKEAQSLGAGFWRLSFTVENGDECRRVMENAISCLKNAGAPCAAGREASSGLSTRGHFKRGVL